MLTAIFKLHFKVSYKTLELMLKDKLRYSPDFSSERVFNIKEYHTIVAVDGAYFEEPKLLWTILDSFKVKA